MTMALDRNEMAVLLALQEVDPNSEEWVAPWAPTLDLAKHGADAIAATSAKMVFARLCARNLLDGQPGVRGHFRGYSLNDKGREALAASAL